MDAIGNLLFPTRQTATPSVVSGHAGSVAAVGTTSITVAGEEYQSQPIAGNVRGVASGQDLLCVRVGRQLTALEGGGFYAAR